MCALNEQNEWRRENANIARNFRGVNTANISRERERAVIAFLRINGNHFSCPKAAGKEDRERKIVVRTACLCVNGRGDCALIAGVATRR